MSQQNINIGTSANDGTGDPLRTAFSKTQDNFTELYAAVSALSNIDILSVSTAGGTITLNFASEEQRIFVGSASFATAKAVALSNDSIARRLDFIFTITNVNAVLTFPAAFVMNDVRWNTSSQEWEPDQTGTFKASAIFDGTNWIMDISNPYS